LPTSTYPLWYNVIPPFVPLKLSLYPAYLIGTKRLDPSIFRNYTSYVVGYVYLILEQPIVQPTLSHSIGNQFLTVVQPIISRDNKLVQQQVIVLIPTTIQVNISLPIHVPKGFAHRPLDGGQQIGIHLEEMHPKEINLKDHH
jgi:hypothetical protein